jgi:hypothetical protein
MSPCQRTLPRLLPMGRVVIALTLRLLQPGERMWKSGICSGSTFSSSMCSTMCLGLQHTGVGLHSTCRRCMRL